MEIFVKHKKYVLNDKNLLCEVVIQKQNQMLDLDTRTLKLYWCKKDIFILDEVHDINGQHETPIFMNKTEAQSFTDKYPFNVNKKVQYLSFTYLCTISLSLLIQSFCVTTGSNFLL